MYLIELFKKFEIIFLKWSELVSIFNNILEGITFIPHNLDK